MDTSPQQTSRVLLAVDGNSLLHRSYHARASTGLRSPDGRATWAVDGLIQQVCGAVNRVRADALVIGFDDHATSVRKARWPHYKATRSEKPPELGEQIQLAIDTLRAAGVHVVVPDGLEADDVLASAAASATAAGWRTVVITSDRDSFALVSETTSVLRLINGGVDGSPILTPARLPVLYNIEAGQYREYAAMRGDSSDNLAGLPGVGEKTAAKLLAAFGSMDKAFADVDTNGGALVRAAAGPAMVKKLADPGNRAAYEETVEIMTMVDTLDLGIDFASPGAGLLPLDPDPVQSAFGALGLVRATRMAVASWCGLGAPAPAVAPTDPDDGWVPPPALDEHVPYADDEYYPPPVDPGYSPQRFTPPAPQDVPAATRPAPALVPAAAMTPSAAPPPNWQGSLF